MGWPAFWYEKGTRKSGPAVGRVTFRVFFYGISLLFLLFANYLCMFIRTEFA